MPRPTLKCGMLPFDIQSVGIGKMSKKSAFKKLIESILVSRRTKLSSLAIFVINLGDKTSLGFAINFSIFASKGAGFKFSFLVL
jgi:hypothetical protein